MNYYKLNRFRVGYSSSWLSCSRYYYMQLLSFVINITPISILSYAVSTGSKSLKTSNTSFSYFAGYQWLLVQKHYYSAA